MEYNSDPRLTWREICRLIKGHILFYPLIVIFSLWSHFCVRLSSYSNNWASLRKRITVLTVVNCSKFPVCVANSNFVQQPEDDWSGLQRSFGQESPGQVQVSLSFKTGLTGFTQCFFFFSRCYSDPFILISLTLLCQPSGQHWRSEEAYCCTDGNTIW